MSQRIEVSKICEDVDNGVRVSKTIPKASNIPLEFPKDQKEDIKIISFLNQLRANANELKNDVEDEIPKLLKETVEFEEQINLLMK